MSEAKPTSLLVYTPSHECVVIEIKNMKNDFPTVADGAPLLDSKGGFKSKDFASAVADTTAYVQALRKRNARVAGTMLVRFCALVAAPPQIFEDIVRDPRQRLEIARIHIKEPQIEPLRPPPPPPSAPLPLHISGKCARMAVK